jgi:LmbE family N-acetylglucosaminyl deacetylase
MLHTNKILVLAPHTDDGELGCGGAISKYIAAGKEVTYVAFSTCSQSLPKGLPADTLVTECRAATAALGIKEVIFFDFEVRQFSFHRQEILEELVRLNITLQPQTVFIPAKADVHQDHQVIYAEGLRAFKACNVLGYELPWNNLEFSPTYFETLTETEVAAKQKALAEYRSQAHRRYMQPGFTEALAVVRGIQCAVDFAEAFEVYRMRS